MPSLSPLANPSLPPMDEPVSSGRRRTSSFDEDSVEAAERNRRDDRRHAEEDFESFLQPLTAAAHQASPQESPEPEPAVDDETDPQVRHHVSRHEATTGADIDAEPVPPDNTAATTGISQADAVTATNGQHGGAPAASAYRGAASATPTPWSTAELAAGTAGLQSSQGDESIDSVSTAVDEENITTSPGGRENTYQEFPAETASAATPSAEGANEATDMAGETAEFAQELLRQATDISDNTSAGMAAAADGDLQHSSPGEGVPHSLAVSASEPGANSTSPASAEPRQPLTSQLARAITEFSRTETADGESTIKLRLDPPELGELVIRMERSDERLALRVEAIDPGTLDMLLARGSELEQQLRKQMDLDGLEFSAQLLTDSSDGQGTQREHTHDRRQRMGQHVASGRRTGTMQEASGAHGLSFRA